MSGYTPVKNKISFTENSIKPGKASEHTNGSQRGILSGYSRLRAATDRYQNFFQTFASGITQAEVEIVYTYRLYMTQRIL